MSPRLIRLLAMLNRRARGAADEIDVVRRASNAAAEHTFGWAPRPAEVTVLDTARSLARTGATTGSA